MEIKISPETVWFVGLCLQAEETADDMTKEDNIQLKHKEI